MQEERVVSPVELELVAVAIVLSIAAVILLALFILKDPREKAIQALKNIGATSKETAVLVRDIHDIKTQDLILKTLIDAEMHQRNAFVLRDPETSKVYLVPGLSIPPKTNRKLVIALSIVPVTMLLIALLVGLNGL